ncbi:MAG TPA: SPOR domain-containing protein [Terriglobales bacterium]|jgi:DedD protein|nr:SPOR domain-containing protein [Terriglobales bacterium]
MTTAKSEDTEITLGTGKMLALFFGLVTLCAVFFSMGFSLGKNSGLKPSAAEASPVAVTAAANVRPSAVKPTTPAADMTFYKAVSDKSADSQLATPGKDTPGTSTDAAVTSPTPANTTSSADPTVAPPANAYYVQVAAVSKLEDADALVDALKKKQYPAFSANTTSDKLFHIQVGPYVDIKDAEAMRTKLVTDGYNPILKK